MRKGKSDPVMGRMHRLIDNLASHFQRLYQIGSTKREAVVENSFDVVRGMGVWDVIFKDLFD